MRGDETKSLLLHDLVHFAVESEAGLREAFYGSVARGGNYDAEPWTDEAREAESVVGPLQGALKGVVDSDAFVTRFRAAQQSIGSTAPAWLTPELIARVLERLHQLQGQWRATPFGETMELSFPLD